MSEYSDYLRVENGELTERGREVVGNILDQLADGRMVHFREEDRVELAYMAEAVRDE